MGAAGTGDEQLQAGELPGGQRVTRPGLRAEVGEGKPKRVWGGRVERRETEEERWGTNYPHAAHHARARPSGPKYRSRDRVI